MNDGQEKPILVETEDQRQGRIAALGIGVPVLSAALASGIAYKLFDSDQITGLGFLIGLILPLCIKDVRQAFFQVAIALGITGGIIALLYWIFS